MLNVSKHLACPICKSPIKKVDFSETLQGRMKFGGVVCTSCHHKVGQVNFGKFDFLRVSDQGLPQIEDHICKNFTYKRIPWSDSSVTSSGLVEYNLGWNAEGFSGVLFADSQKDWEITIKTSATDLGLRCHSHGWSGAINVTVNGGNEQSIDLYDESEADIKMYLIFINLEGEKMIKITPSSTYKSPNGNQLFFAGYDACFDTEVSDHSTTRSEINRGNGFPKMYDWVLSHLSDDALVLDCGAGDRSFKDSRYIGFEYLPFELPDVFGDGHALPFADEVFDVVFSQAVMEHMRDPYLAAREIVRVLKPGGLVYVESAFMQPLHAVPYHFFNTTPWGIEVIFVEAGLSSEAIEWFGALSESVKWYLDSCGGNISRLERKLLMEILCRVDRKTDYESLKPVASAVAFWGVKPGEKSDLWQAALKKSDRPTFKY
jgi:SAM-dependent methyltransferase